VRVAARARPFPEWAVVMGTSNHQPAVAYFSMEIGLESLMPTYAGGLGVLAGDTVRAAADLGVPMLAVTLLHRRGYLRQTLDASGWQAESPVEWPVEQYLESLPQRAGVTVEGRTVRIRPWRYLVKGVTGHQVPVIFLDTDLPENAEDDRTLTHFLYGGDARYRLAQEVVLGIGGVRMLDALGLDERGYRRFHMNEGHAALLGLELLEREAARAGRTSVNWDDVEAVRARCVFTTHTPVPAGHDRFALDLVRRVLGPRNFEMDWRGIVAAEGQFNMTYLALSLSGYVNGVAKRHAEVARLMFARYQIAAITNGVHAATWASPPFAALFDRHIPDWRRDNFALRYAHGLPRDEVSRAHADAKAALLSHVASRTGVTMEPGIFTLGFARRATAYKRADLLFQDVGRLKALADEHGPVQVVYAGKAHPRDEEGKRLIARIVAAAESLKGSVAVAYLPDYDMAQAKLVTAGVDVWLNTPQPPLEASGTSGMKAAVNGVPSLSVLDGWWIEGCIEGVTGWAIGADGRVAAAADEAQTGADRGRDAESLYERLEGVVLPMFYRDPARFADLMVHCISLNASFFNTHRMVQQYVLSAYFG
jgi:starch phosphorylase